MSNGFWYRLTTPRYVRLLEQWNEDLKAENESLKLALFPALQRQRTQREAKAANGSGPQPVRRADHAQSQSGEPAKLQPVSLKRPSWQEARAKLEYLTDVELKEAQRLEKAVAKY